MLNNLATFVVRHARLVLVAALVAVIGMGVLGGGAFGKLQAEGFDDPDAESTAASELIEQHYEGDSDLVFLARARAGSGSGSVDDPDAADAGAALTAELAADPAVEAVVSYWEVGAPSLRSEDGASALIVANLAEGESADAVERYTGTAGLLDVTLGGGAVAGDDITEQVERDLLIAELIAVPLILVLLLVVFGSVVAALLPLAVGTVAILGTFAVLSVLGGLTDVSIFAINLTTALGLALGIDYALLMVSRYREELARGVSVAEAVVKTVETAGRTIVFSGLAVAAALAALLLFPLYFLRSFAYAGIGVVVIAMLGALVVLPALLAVLGPRVNAGRLPWARSVTRGSEAPFWGRLAAAVMRRPLIAGGAVVTLLLLAASPLLHASFGTPDDRVLPTSAASRQVGDALRDEFAADQTSAIDVVTTGQVEEAALAGYATELSMLPSVERVDSSAGTFVAGSSVGNDPSLIGLGTPSTERLTVVTAVDPASSTARDLVADVRAVTPPGDVDALVGGQTASLVDSLAAIGARLPVAAGLIALTTFVVLFLFTGSIVQPVRALITNALTLGAVFGLMVLVFQDGFASSLLGFTPVPLDMAMMVLLFCITFGLSMDYEVFVMSRIKERHAAGADVERATVYGLTHSGRIVTAAAVLIAVAFFAFVSSQVSFLQLFGLGAGLAILLDATLVRGVLVPASMRLFGERSWYAPRALRRLHGRIGIAEA
jgi:RND superfamily putative drug exporter